MGQNTWGWCHWQQLLWPAEKQHHRCSSMWSLCPSWVAHTEGQSRWTNQGWRDWGMWLGLRTLGVWWCLLVLVRHYGVDLSQVWVDTISIIEAAKEIDIESCKQDRVLVEDDWPVSMAGIQLGEEARMCKLMSDFLHSGSFVVISADGLIEVMGIQAQAEFAICLLNIGNGGIPVHWLV